MKKKFLFAVLLAVIANEGFGQTIDSLKLNKTELPPGYSMLNELQCVTPYASSFYDQADLYESLLGKVTNKGFQSFSKKGDKGSILYFEFERDFRGQSFLSGLLWGQDTKPSNSKPDEYYAKGKILIIWSLNLKSGIKEISKAKVTKLLP